MLGMPSFVTIDWSIHELFSENPRSPKTRKSVAIREAVSDHSGTVRWGRPRARHAPRMVHYIYSTVTLRSNRPAMELSRTGLVWMRPDEARTMHFQHQNWNSFGLQSGNPCRLGAANHILLGGRRYRPRDLQNYLLIRYAKFKTNLIVLLVNIRNRINNRPWRHWWLHRSGQSKNVFNCTGLSRLTSKTSSLSRSKANDWYGQCLRHLWI